jgi:dynein heavy chain
MINAQKLNELLFDEGERWKEEIITLENDEVYLRGNVFIAASSLSYLGPFTGKYRNKMISKWKSSAREVGIDISKNYSLVNTIGDQIHIRNWKINGLPSDSVSVDNAIIAQKSKRWPLMIDPQNQANTWIKKMFKQMDMGDTKVADNDWSNLNGGQFKAVKINQDDQ